MLSEISEESKLDRKELTRKLKSFLHHIYFKYLQINPKDRRVILCESPVNLTELRETLADVLFTYFEVLQFYLKWHETNHSHSLSHEHSVKQMCCGSL